MKWIFLAVVLGVSQMALFSEEPKKFSTLKEKWKKLEEDTGIDVRKEKTTYYFSGEFIYWKTSLDGVAYATTAKLVEDPSGAGLVLNKFKTRSVHFDYDPAFQIALGIGLPHDYWDLSVRWQRSFTKGKDTAHREQGIVPGNRLILDSVGLIEGLAVPPNKGKSQVRCASEPRRWGDGKNVFMEPLFYN